MPIQEFIAKVNSKLTPTERRVAQIVLDDPTLLAFGTVTELANRADTSSPTIVRFAHKLGFEGYSDLQRTIRAGLSNQLNNPTHRIRQRDHALAPVRDEMVSSVEQLFDTIDDQQLRQIAARIGTASHVWILTGETSKGGAMVLQSGLSMLRANTRLVGEHSTGHELSGATPDDLVVIFDFARYRRNPISAAKAMRELGVPIVAVTDGPLSPLVALTDDWVQVHIPAVGPFDSSVTSVLMAELLVAHTAHALGERAERHIDQLESVWRTTGTYLEYRPRTGREVQDE